MSYLLARKIQDVTCEFFGITYDDLLSQKRYRTMISARQIAIYICRTKLNLSYPEIGRLFNRDHSTIIHSYQKISARLMGKEKIFHHEYLISVLEKLAA